MTFVGVDRRKVDRLVQRHRPAVGRDELVALAHDGRDRAVEQDPPRLHVVGSLRGRSRPKRTIGRMPKGFMLPRSPEGRASIVPAPSVALLRRRADDRVPDRSGERRGAAPRRRRARRRGPGRRRGHLGRLAVVLATGRRAPRPGPLPVQGSASSSSGARYGGETYSRCVYIWVDKDFALARGWYQGYPKKLGAIWMTRPVTVGKAGPRLEPGGRVRRDARGQRPSPRRRHAHPHR